jgi:hypothetical protein
LESREGFSTILVSKDLEHFVHDAIGPSFTDTDREILFSQAIKVLTALSRETASEAASSQVLQLIR